MSIFDVFDELGVSTFLKYNSISLDFYIRNSLKY